MTSTWCSVLLRQGWFLFMSWASFTNDVQFIIILPFWELAYQAIFCTILNGTEFLFENKVWLAD